LENLVFDITSTAPKYPNAAVSSYKKSGDDTLTFALDFPVASSPEASTAKDVGIGEIDLNLDNFRAPENSSSSELKDERWHEVATKLDLAKAYQEMGDAAGAKEILEEVVRDGDEQQRASAQSLIEQLSS
jgi:pilus assembly protein FimV